MPHLVFLFGEAEKGHRCTPVLCHSLEELSERFGNPPEQSLGLFYAIQALHYKRELIYFRVAEEGYSISDYKRGLSLLRHREILHKPSAICMPGVGDAHIIDETSEICYLLHCMLITTEKDFYDYLTHLPL
ncbi:MAG TPA: hypothetical protein VGJ00_01180 [Rhabdochlamydiaceae bacterium]|jgi:hypothetical protein